MPLTGWPSIVDDSGSGTDGSAADKDWSDELRASIEASLFSGTNPTVDPSETTDEVITARAGQDDLNTRLLIIEGQVGGIDTPDSSTLAASENVARNPDLAAWKLGAAAAPDHYTLSGTGAAIARTGSGESDSVTVNAGPFSAKITYGSATARLTQIAIPTADFVANSALGLDGRKVSLTARVRASVVDLARIGFTDGVTTTYSDYHTGGGTPENLTVVHTISGSATKLEWFWEVAQSGAAYFGGAIATFADSPAPGWAPPPRYGERVLDLNVTPAGTVGAPLTDLMSYIVAPGLLRAGTVLHVECMGFTAANATAKTCKFLWGANSTTLFTTGHNNKAWKIDVWILRLSSGAQRVFVGGNVSTTVINLQSAATEDETNDVTIKCTGDAGATNDIVQSFMRVTLIEAGSGA